MLLFFLSKMTEQRQRVLKILLYLKTCTHLILTAALLFYILLQFIMNLEESQQLPTFSGKNRNLNKNV